MKYMTIPRLVSRREAEDYVIHFCIDVVIVSVVADIYLSTLKMR